MPGSRPRTDSAERFSSMEKALPSKPPKVLATSCSVHENGQKGESDASTASRRQSHGNHYFKSAQWTADGTSVITDSADNRVRTYIIPPDLLEERDHELSLDCYSQILFAEAVKALTTYPLFDLQDPTTTLLLCSFADHPIRLHSALSHELVASYPFVNAATEAYISPHTLTFTGDGRSFVCGSKNLLAIFDVSRPGDGPTSFLPTASTRKGGSPSNSIGMKGIVSALAIEPASNVLAAGTFSRHIGLYNASGQGEKLGVFRVDGNEADCRIGGGGITQLMWSPCGRYLYLVERCSGGVMLYDIRKTGQLLSWVEGRYAETNQRLGVDLHDSSHIGGGLEIWAGGADGNMRMWINTHYREGSQQPDLEWPAHQDAVSSTIVHRSGSVVASCSGQRHFDQSDNGDSDVDSQHGSTPVDKTIYDNSLKLWAI